MNRMRWDLELVNQAAESVHHHHRVTFSGQLIRLALTAVIRYGDLAVKISAPGHRSLEDTNSEIKLIIWLREQGINAPEPLGEAWESSGCIVSASRFLIADTHTPLDWGKVGSFVKELHSLTIPTELPELQVKHGQYEKRITSLYQQGSIDNVEKDLLEELLASTYVLDKLPTHQQVFCHNDLHSGNFLMVNDQLHVLDWENACYADALVDLSSIIERRQRYGLSQEHYQAFCQAYGSDAVDDPLAAALSRLSAVSGVSYLMLSAGEKQQQEGRRRLDSLIENTNTIWTDC